MTLKPKGGRGKQAPYQTKTMRVPLPLVNQFEGQIEQFRDVAINGIADQDDPCSALSDRMGFNKVTRNEAIKKAKLILKSKKSARISMTKLLQVIYNDDSIEL